MIEAVTCVCCADCHDSTSLVKCKRSCMRMLAEQKPVLSNDLQSDDRKKNSNEASLIEGGLCGCVVVGSSRANFVDK